MKSLRPFLFIIFISLLPFVSIFLNDTLPHTSDGGVQIPRMAAFYKAVMDGHFPVRWAGDLNYGYGLPLFNFIYHTPFYISTILIGLGFSLITSFKIILLLSFIFSGLFMYLFSYAFFKDQKKALFATILYQFAPYRLVEILTRGSVGGIYAYTFLPLVLWSITLVWKKPTALAITCISAATMLMILSHNALALLFFFCISLFVLLFSPQFKALILSLVGLVGGLGLSSYYWIPALLEHKYTYGDLFMTDLYKSNFPPFLNLFIPNPFNVESLRVAEINVHIGLVHSVVLIVGLGLLLKTIIKFSRRQLIASQQNRLRLYSFSLLAGSLFFMSSFSIFFWKNISFLRQFQFPWRFLAIPILSLSLLSSQLIDIPFFRKKSTYFILLLFTIIPTMYHWRPTQGITYNATNQQFWDYPLNTTYFGETDVIWSAGPAKSFPPSRIEVIQGNAIIQDFQKKTHIQTFLVNATESARLVSNTQYFPGWRVYVDGKRTPIEFQDQNWRGLITFAIQSGTHNVRIQFEESAIRFGANSISLGSGLVLLISLLFSSYNKFTKKNTT